MYTPPFNITASIVNKIAEISAQMERYAIRLEQADGLRLRKANRIKTIHSSLAIEGNTLTETQVRDIIDGKTVVAPIKQIQEVKNAIATYNLYGELNPFSVKDLLRAHGTMMQALTDDAGRFRSGGVGVFSDTGLVHMAPPAERVPLLIDDLFEWLRSADDHLLIRSCVFHYEFEFIHPFSDGNGRTGRLWQSLILGRLHPLFEHLPVENMVFARQQDYYDAIAASTREGQSGPFIDFMLGEILRTLKSHQGEELNTEVDGVKFSSAFAQTFSESFARTFARTFARIVPTAFKTKANQDKAFVACQQILVTIKTSTAVNASSLAAAVGVSERTVKTYMRLLSDAKIIAYSGTTNNGKWNIVLKARNK